MKLLFSIGLLSLALAGSFDSLDMMNETGGACDPGGGGMPCVQNVPYEM